MAPGMLIHKGNAVKIMQLAMAASLLYGIGSFGFAYSEAPTPALAPGTGRGPLVLSLGPSSAQAKVQYPNNVEGLFDITYESLSGFRPVKLDLYRTVGAHAPQPAVVFLHGGGFAVGSPRTISPVFGEMDRVLARLAARGYVVVGATYRLSGEVRFPGPVEDVKAAVRWLRANAAKYAIDPERVGVWGESAGGYLAVMVGTSCKVEGLEGRGGNPDQSSCVQAVVDWYAPTDLSRIDAQALPDARGKHDAVDSPESKLLGCALAQCPPELLRQANPLSYITASAPPFLIMHGEKDTVVPPAQSQLLREALRTAGVTATFVTVPGVNHGFVGASAAEGQTLLDQVFQFLDATLISRR